MGKCRTPGRGAALVLEISMRRASPSAMAATASRITTGAAQLPPIHPVSLPSGVMIAFAPGFADVGRSARTTVAVAKGSRRASSWRRARRRLRSRRTRSPHRPAAADVAEELRDPREAVERVRREVVVGMTAERAGAARIGRVIAGTRERVEPDEAVRRTLQARRLLLKPSRIAALPPVGDEQNDRPTA